MFDYGDLPKHLKFRGENVLSVHESPEPTEIMWERLQIRTYGDSLGRSLLSFGFISFCCTVSVYIIGSVSQYPSKYAQWWTATSVSVLSSIVPQIIEFAVEHETHMSRSGYECAIMGKTFMFEIMTSALAIYMFTPFEKTLDPSYLDQVQQVLVFDSLVGPFVGWLQPWKRLKRAWVAPIETNPAVRESYFRGFKVCLGAELSHRMSTLFLGLFACSILPLGLGVTCVAFVVAYWTGKHGLFRRWLRLPTYGTALLPVVCLCTYFGIFMSMVMTGRK